MPADELIRFSVVGVIGFAVDGGLLTLAVSSGVDPFLARAISFPPAVFATWLLNRVWTFSSACRTAPARQLSRYVVVQLHGVAANYVVYAITLALLSPSLTAALVGFAAGSAAGLIVNFTGSRLLVFTGRAGSTTPDDFPSTGQNLDTRTTKCNEERLPLAIRSVGAATAEPFPQSEHNNAAGNVCQPHVVRTSQLAGAGMLPLTGGSDCREFGGGRHVD